MKIIIIIPIFLMLITSCAKSPTPTSASTETSTPINSGIEGQALIGPTCAGPVRVDSNCDDQPYQATLTVFSPKGERIVQVQTDEDGRFRDSACSGGIHPASRVRENYVCRRADRYCEGRGVYTGHREL